MCGVLRERVCVWCVERERVCVWCVERERVCVYGGCMFDRERVCVYIPLQMPIKQSSHCMYACVCVCIHTASNAKQTIFSLTPAAAIVNATKILFHPVCVCVCVCMCMYMCMCIYRALSCTHSLLSYSQTHTHLT